MEPNCCLRVGCQIGVMKVIVGGEAGLKFNEEIHRLMASLYISSNGTAEAKSKVTTQ